MKAMILAAGRGERMRPLTEHTPKPLLYAGKYRLIEHLLFALAKAGYLEIVINTAYLAEQFNQALGNGKKYGVRIAYTKEPATGALEMGGGIINALPLLGDEPFLVVSGDLWTDYPFQQLPQTLTGLAHLVLVDNPPFHSKGDFHLTAQGKVLAEGDPLLNFGGIGIYHPQLFANCQAGKLRLTPLLIPAMSQGLVTGEHFRGNWWNVGTAQQLAELSDFLTA